MQLTVPRPTETLSETVPHAYRPVGPCPARRRLALVAGLAAGGAVLLAGVLDAQARAAGTQSLAELRAFVPAGVAYRGSSTSVDWNGDGRADLLRVQPAAAVTSRLEVLLAAADGRLEPAPSPYTRVLRNTVAAGDLDGDGDPDALVTTVDVLGGGGAELEVYRNLGPAGIALEAASIAALPSQAELAALVDLDGDGALDLVVLDEFSGVPQVFAGSTGGLAWTERTQGLPGGASGWNDLAVVDADGDGDPDLFVASEAGGLLLDNQGGFVFAPRPAPPDLGTTPLESVAVGDVDGNGRVDVLFGRRLDASGPSTDALYLQDPAGGFLDVSSVLPPRSASVGTPDVALADLDGDGALDVLLARAPVQAAGPFDRLVVLRNAGGTALVDETDAWLPSGTRGTSLDLADLDGDGDLDLVLGARRQRVLLNDGAGRLFDTDPRHPYGHVLVARGDFDADGDPDFVFGGGDYPTVLGGEASAGPASVWRNDGSGWFEADTRVATQAYFDRGAASDVDGDGALDLVVSNPLRVLVGDGTGALAEDPSRVVGTPPLLREVALADLDGDGDDDALSVGLVAGGSGVSALHENVGGALTPRPGAVPGGASVSGPALGDLDGDGDVDALLTDPSRAAGIARWDNAGALQLVDDSAGLPGPRGSDHGVVQARLGDVDGDGDLDVFLPVTSSGFLPGPHEDWLWTNDGTGGFVDASEALAGVVGHTVAGALVDFDEDGDLDVVARDLESSVVSDRPTIRVERNDGRGRFLLVPGDVVPDAALTALGIGDSGQWLADVDADGDLDLVGRGGVLSNLRRQTAARTIPRIGRTFQLEVHGDARFALAISDARASIPLGTLGTLQVDPARLLFLTTGALPPAGPRALAFPLPNDVTLVDTRFFGQSAVGTPLRLSNLEVAVVTGG